MSLWAVEAYYYVLVGHDCYLLINSRKYNNYSTIMSLRGRQGVHKYGSSVSKAKAIINLRYLIHRGILHSFLRNWIMFILFYFEMAKSSTDGEII